MSTFFGLFWDTSGGHLINSLGGDPISSRIGWLIQHSTIKKQMFREICGLKKQHQVEILLTGE